MNISPSKLLRLVPTSITAAPRLLSLSACSQGEKGFLGGFFERKVEVQQASHGSKFAKKERITEIQSHYVKPDSIGKLGVYRLEGYNVMLTQIPYLNLII